MTTANTVSQTLREPTPPCETGATADRGLEPA